MWMAGLRLASDCSMLASRVVIGSCWITLTVPDGPAAAAGLAAGAAWVGAAAAGADVDAACGTTGAAIFGAAVGAAAAGAAGAASAGFVSAGLAGAGGCPQATLSASPLVLMAHSSRNRRRVSGPERRPRSREVI